jgi:hypothetical protein
VNVPLRQNTGPGPENRDKVVNKGPRPSVHLPLFHLSVTDTICMNLAAAEPSRSPTIMASPSVRRASLLKLPLEVTTAIIQEVYRNQIIELDDIGSLARLGDVAVTNDSLAVLKMGMLCDDLAGRLMLWVLHLASFSKAIFARHHLILCSARKTRSDTPIL